MFTACCTCRTCLQHPAVALVEYDMEHIFFNLSLFLTFQLRPRFSFPPVSTRMTIHWGKRGGMCFSQNQAPGFQNHLESIVYLFKPLRTGEMVGICMWTSDGNKTRKVVTKIKDVSVWVSKLNWNLLDSVSTLSGHHQVQNWNWWVHILKYGK